MTMDKTKLLRMAFAALAATMTLASCDDDTDTVWVNSNRPNALVTLKTSDGGGFYMQLDDTQTLWPVNVDKNPYGNKEVRALVSCYAVKGGTAADNTVASETKVYVNWIDSIRTKNAVPRPADKVDETYGNDPVEIVKDWVTVAEDGYLTLCIRTLWGGTGQVHYINLLTGGNPNDPYEVELRHDAKGDTNGHWGDALVAFKLPAVEGEAGKKVKLTLKYKSFTAEKSVQFDYISNAAAAQTQWSTTAGQAADLTGQETERAPYSSRVK